MQSSLRAYDRLADRIKLHRQVDKRSVVVVEGPADRRLIRRLLPDHAVVVFVNDSRDNVLLTASELGKLGLEGVACLVDRDFDDAVENAQARGLPVVGYDGADLEDMLAHSPAMHRLLGELASESKLEDYGGAGVLIARAREQTAPIARIRRLNAARGWSLIFDAVDLPSKVNKETLELNVTGLCMALRRTWDESVPQSELEEVARSGNAGTCPRTGRSLIRGRDLLAVVGVALRKAVGTKAKAQTAPDLLEGVLRSSADLDWLRRTEWFSELVRVAAIQV